jgi:hypothetical protein
MQSLFLCKFRGCACGHAGIAVPFKNQAGASFSSQDAPAVLKHVTLIGQEAGDGSRTCILGLLAL